MRRKRAEPELRKSKIANVDAGTDFHVPKSLVYPRLPKSIDLSCPEAPLYFAPASVDSHGKTGKTTEEKELIGSIATFCSPPFHLFKSKPH